MFSYIFNTVSRFAEVIGLVQKCTELDGSVDKVDDLVKDIDMPIEKVTDNKPICRNFNVKAPYSGPTQIILPQDAKVKVVYNIVVDS